MDVTAVFLAINSHFRTIKSNFPRRRWSAGDYLKKSQKKQERRLKRRGVVVMLKSLLPANTKVCLLFPRLTGGELPLPQRVCGDVMVESYLLNSIIINQSCRVLFHLCCETLCTSDTIFFLLARVVSFTRGHTLMYCKSHTASHDTTYKLYIDINVDFSY